VEGVSDLPEDLPRGGLEIQDASPRQPATSDGTSG
jgi:hypothetical protein